MASSSDYDESSSDGNSYNSEDDEFMIHSNRRRRRNRNGKEANIYGIFYDEETTSGAPSHSNKRRRKELTKPMTFVSANDTKDEIASDGGDNDSDSGDDEEEREKVAADEKFRALLEKATNRNRASFEAVSRERKRDKDPFASKLSERGGAESTASGLHQQEAEVNNNEKVQNVVETVGEGVNKFELAGLGSNTNEGVGLGFNRTDTNSSVNEEAGSGVSGLGFVGTVGLGFGASNKDMNVPKPVSHRQQNKVAKWEKHTKGIGMKLLTKMGYKPGEGIGSGKDGKKGIKQNIEVVVRPANLGLGFGAFKEASQLRENKELESQLHGKPLETNEGGDFKRPIHLSSAAEFLVKEGGWKKQSKQTKRKRNKKRDTGAKDFRKPEAETRFQNIIDMRGPLHSNAVTGTKALGDHLLHKITLLISSSEGNYHTASNLLSSTASKMKTIETDICDIKSRIDLLSKRENIFQTIQRRIEDTEAYVLDIRSSGKEVSAAICRNALQSFVSMKETFQEEFDVLSLSSVAPMLIKPLYKELLRTWKPLDNPEMAVEVMKDWRSALSSRLSIISVFESLLLPCIRRAILNEWDVLRPVQCILLYRNLMIALNVDGFENTEITTLDKYGERELICLKNILSQYILPKITGKLVIWKPFVSDKSCDHWVMPWKSFLSEVQFNLLLKEIRRKLRSTLSTSRNVSDEKMLLLLLPWKDEFNDKSIERVSDEYIVPDLVKRLARIGENDLFGDYSVYSLIVKWFESGMIAKTSFLALIEGEVMPQWLILFNEFLNSNVTQLEAVQAYNSMKSIFPRSTLTDTKLCEYFYVALMILCRKYQNLGDSQINLPDRSLLSYRKALRRRSKEAKNIRSKSSYSSLHKNAEVYHGFVPGVTRSFREAAEDVFKENGIFLNPRLDNGKIDGKQVYECGENSIPIYFDSDVIFYYQNKTWKPTSIDALMSVAK